MKVRIREGNDFDVVWAIKRGGTPEDFTNAYDVKFSMIVYKHVIDVTLPENPFTGNILSLNIPKEIIPSTGDYRLVLEYTLPDAGQPDGDLKCKTDVVPFRIVPFTADADDVYTVNTSSDVLLGFKGDKGEDGDDAYQIWLDLGNEGTYEDFIAYMRQPAVDAGASISELEGEIQASEELRVSAETARVNAEGDATKGRVKAENDRVTAEGERAAAETERANAEGDATKGRVKAENDRVTAEGERAAAETARANAEGDATKGRVKAENDRVAAEGEREQAFAQMMGEADDKIEEMDTTLSTYDGRVTQVESDISQLAGDVSDSTEKAGAASLSELNARLLALEKIVSATITNKLEVTKEFNVWGKTNLILTGSGAATFAPDFIGQKYIDTTGGNIYVAVGVATAGNWKLV